MDYICAIAEYCTEPGRFLEWTGPSGFPVSNRYQVPNIVTVNCMRGSVRVAEHNIADGVTDQIDHSKVNAAAAPNFVHSLDAAHLIKTVNAAVSEGRHHRPADGSRLFLEPVGVPGLYRGKRRRELRRISHVCGVHIDF